MTAVINGGITGTAKSTRRAYARDVIYFWRWAQLSLQQDVHYPVSEEILIRFVLEHIGTMSPALEKELIKEGTKKRPGPLKTPTLRRYLASLSIAHQETGVNTPTQAPKVKILLRRVKQAQSDNRPNKKAAITKEILEAMLTTCDDSLTGGKRSGTVASRIY